MKRKILFSALIGMALLLAACGSAATPIATAAQPPATVATAAPLALPTTVPPTVAPATVAPATAAPATTAPVSTPTGPANLAVGQNATLGSFLTDSNGMTLYLYTQDTANTSN
ncbi:MAG: hypothetical protein ABSA23_02730 [Anaerolineales bacterium]|jgi:predicted lipoprotein with Yx(FWY)xxD motif